MKLAEALVLRADLQKRVEQLRERLGLVVLIQEGDLPPEDPRGLLEELGRIVEQLRLLVARINRTNVSVRLADGRTLTEALADRDALKLHFSILSKTARAASQRVDKYSRSEIRYVSTVNVSELRQQADALAKQYRELDTAIQSLNWTIELQE